MTLHKRLAKLEAEQQVRQTGPSIIFHDIVWRTESGGVQSIGAFADVRTASGWQKITRKDDEPAAEFEEKAAAMACLSTKAAITCSK